MDPHARSSASRIHWDNAPHDGNEGANLEGSDEKLPPETNSKLVIPCLRDTGDDHVFTEDQLMVTNPDEGQVVQMSGVKTGEGDRSVRIDGKQVYEVKFEISAQWAMDYIKPTWEQFWQVYCYIRNKGYCTTADERRQKILYTKMIEAVLEVAYTGMTSTSYSPNATMKRELTRDEKKHILQLKSELDLIETQDSQKLTEELDEPVAVTTKKDAGAKHKTIKPVNHSEWTYNRTIATGLIFDTETPQVDRDSQDKGEQIVALVKGCRLPKYELPKAGCLRKPEAAAEKEKAKPMSYQQVAAASEDVAEWVALYQDTPSPYWRRELDLLLTERAVTYLEHRLRTKLNHNELNGMRRARDKRAAVLYLISKISHLRELYPKMTADGISSIADALSWAEIDRAMQHTSPLGADTKAVYMNVLHSMDVKMSDRHNLDGGIEETVMQRRGMTEELKGAKEAEKAKQAEIDENDEIIKKTTTEIGSEIQASFDSNREQSQPSSSQAVSLETGPHDTQTQDEERKVEYNPKDLQRLIRSTFENNQLRAFTIKVFGEPVIHHKFRWFFTCHRGTVIWNSINVQYDGTVGISQRADSVMPSIEQIRLLAELMDTLHKRSNCLGQIYALERGASIIARGLVHFLDCGRYAAIHLYGPYFVTNPTGEDVQDLLFTDVTSEESMKKVEEIAPVFRVDPNDYTEATHSVARTTLRIHTRRDNEFYSGTLALVDTIYG